MPRPARRIASRTAVKGVRLPDLLEFQTSSGLKIILAQRGPLPLVTLQLVVQAGSATDPSGKQGLADFTAALLRRGTQKHTADEINEAVEFCGASLASGADEDFLSIRITAPSEHMRPMLEILGELVSCPSFPRKEVDAARARVLAQIANDLDDPGLVADRALLRAVWGSHPYGHDVVGTERDVRSFTRQDVARFHRSRFSPSASLLIIAGVADEREVKASTERVFRGWQRGPECAAIIPPLQRAAMAGRILLLDKPGQTQSQVRVGGMGFRKGDPDVFAASVMNTVLGGSFTSRLMEAIRVNRGLSYGVSSAFDRLMAGGTFSVSTFTRTETTRTIVDVTLSELAKMRRTGPSPEELNAAKTYLAGLFPLRFETNDAVAAAIAEIRLYNLGDDWVERYRERISEVSIEQAKQMARKYLFAELDERATMVIVGNARAVKPQLAGLGPTKVIKASELE